MGLIIESPEPSPAISPPTSLPKATSPEPPALAVPEQPADSHLRLISPIPPISPFEGHGLGIETQENETPQSPEPVSPLRDPTNSNDSSIKRHPKRYSSLGMPNQNSVPPASRSGAESVALPDIRTPESFYDSNSSSDGDARSPPPEVEAKPWKPRIPELNASMPPSFSSDYDLALRSRQPLPSLPPQPAAARKPSTDQIRGHRMSQASMLSPTLPPTKSISPNSRRSSRASRSVNKSPAASRSSPNLRTSSHFSASDLSWEDSVDLAYEEEAESTCDFAWNQRHPPTRGDRSGSRTSDSKRDSAATVSRAESPNLSNRSESLISLYRNSSTDTIAERRTEDHKRGTSVGHRGFLAARKNSSTPDLLSKAKEPPAPLSFSQAPAPVTALSPVFSVADEDVAPKTPFTPAELHYPRIERVSNDYLSDPESYRNSNSSKHRKSSSYGSYGSYDSAGAKAGPPNSSNNTTRWSIASSGSMSELMHNRPKSKSSLSRSVTSQPLETLPQSPPGSGEETETRSAPLSQPEPSKRASPYRGSGESSDRVMQAAGRVVQRGRPGSYARYSQNLEPQAPPQGGVRESWVAGPDWI